MNTLYGFYYGISLLSSIHGSFVTTTAISTFFHSRITGSFTVQSTTVEDSHRLQLLRKISYKLDEKNIDIWRQQVE